jgi:betaine-aldehyde dehydrogenase
MQSDVATIVLTAKQAREKWQSFSVEERCQFLQKLPELLQKNQEELARLIVTEMGKTITQAKEEVVDCIQDINDNITQAKKYLTERIIFEDEKNIGKIIFEPWGVAAVIAPWNYPLEMPIWGIIPNLLAGNTVVFKPSEYTPLCGQKLADLISQLNLPEGVFNIIVGGKDIGAQLVDSDIDYVWFTGSAKVGQEIYAKAGKKFIKATLELGGSSPAIVFSDVNVDSIINELYNARFSNCGQVCSALKRLFVHESIFTEVVEKLKNRIAQVKPQTDMGRLVSEKQLNLLEAQVQDAINKGAKVIIGGKRPENLSGPYYLPTLLTNIIKNMRVYQEEVFGPVLPIMPFDTKEEAIQLANDTIYGLTAIVYSQDKKLAEEVASKIKAGRIGVNTNHYFNSDCPFGGYKKSGMGREHGEFGWYELTQIKHIHLKK